MSSQKARICDGGGATGLIFGRNVWQRPFDDALALSKEMSQMLRDYGA